MAAGGHDHEVVLKAVAHYKELAAAKDAFIGNLTKVPTELTSNALDEFAQESTIPGGVIFSTPIGPITLSFALLKPNRHGLRLWNVTARDSNVTESQDAFLEFDLTHDIGIKFDPNSTTILARNPDNKVTELAYRDVRVEILKALLKQRGGL